MSSKSIQQVWDNSRTRYGKMFLLAGLIAGVSWLWSIAPIPGAGLMSGLRWLTTFAFGVTTLPILLIAPLWWWKHVGRVVWQPEQFLSYARNYDSMCSERDARWLLLVLSAAAAVGVTAIGVANSLGFFTWLGIIGLLMTVGNFVGWAGYRLVQIGREDFREWREALSSNNETSRLRQEATARQAEN